MTAALSIGSWIISISADQSFMRETLALPDSVKNEMLDERIEIPDALAVLVILARRARARKHADIEFFSYCGKDA